MNKRRLWLLITGILVLPGWQAIAPARAQSSGGSFAITHSIVVPAATLSDGAFQLRGSVGQPLTGTASGSGYAINAGFVSSGDSIFHNGFESQ
ncbi:MAG: hypothetical protein ACREPN_01985 [Rudaea sp.]